eukprot:TRINITY_DN12062_c0_g1_i7.p1 TRINITY_DN12062_c0_g1~~TRINITY_DN12062_c0_g1_i7.p1  ORF type:complete len:445 (+),score=38.96 TRINITY_DN12062_c0_g1_i7:183-1517(+)
MLLVVGLLLNTRTAFSLRYLNNIANVNLSDVLPSIEDGQVQLLTTYYGHYPIIESETGQWCNGGLPQLANITAHKLKAASDIRKRIAPGASVFGVFDYENWRLHWNTTSDIYRLNSILLANYTTPGLPPDELLAKAKKDFETAGLKFFLATVHQANELFPESRFGFYSYPNIGFWRSDAQVAHLQQLNNRLLPLWQASTALFPSVYLPYKSNVDAAYALNQLYLDRTIGQSGGGSSPPVYPYTWHRYHDGEPHGLQLLDDLDFHLEFASAHNYTDNSNFAGGTCMRPYPASRTQSFPDDQGLYYGAPKATLQGLTIHGPSLPGMLIYSRRASVRIALLVIRSRTRKVYLPTMCISKREQMLLTTMIYCVRRWSCQQTDGPLRHSHFVHCSAVSNDRVARIQQPYNSTFVSTFYAGSQQSTPAFCASSSSCRRKRSFCVAILTTF